MCKPKIKKMNLFLTILTMGSILGLTLFPFGIYIHKNYLFWETVMPLRWKKLITHETIHWKQQITLFITGLIITVLAGIIIFICNAFSWWMLSFLVFPFLFFYIWYFLEWFIKLFLPPYPSAYKDICFECEANLNEENPDYLKTRKPFAFLKYLFKHCNQA